MLLASAGAAETVLAHPISNDPYTNTNGDVQHRTQVEPDSFAFGNTIVAVTQSGRYVNGGGASNLVFSSSQNAGKTWTTGGMPGEQSGKAAPGRGSATRRSPMTPSTTSGCFWALGSTPAAAATSCSSTAPPTAATWSNPVNAGESSGKASDKTWITCDTWAASPHYGNCYIQFDDNGQGNAMKMVTSTDGGVTWGPGPDALAASGLGGQPVVQPNGNVIVPFSANGGAQYSIRSTDGMNRAGARSSPA